MSVQNDKNPRGGSRPLGGLRQSNGSKMAAQVHTLRKPKAMWTIDSHTPHTKGLTNLYTIPSTLKDWEHPNLSHR